MKPKKPPFTTDPAGRIQVLLPSYLNINFDPNIQKSVIERYIAAQTIYVGCKKNLAEIPDLKPKVRKTWERAVADWELVDQIFHD